MQRVTHLTLDRTWQSIHGPLRGSLTADGTGGGYEMHLLPRLGLIEVQHPNWLKSNCKDPVYIPAAQCVFSTEEPLREPQPAARTSR